MARRKYSRRRFLIVIVLISICGGIAWRLSSVPPKDIEGDSSAARSGLAAMPSAIGGRDSGAPPIPLSRKSSDLLAEEGAEDPLMGLIPEWLRENGEMHRDRIELDGQWVERVQGRYGWPDGEMIELQISDLGDQATENQFKSLGFDLALEPEETDASIILVEDGDGYAANMEFYSEDLEGNVQIVVAGRYLMEIQMEGFPFESFQAMESRDGVFSTLQEYAERP